MKRPLILVVDDEAPMRKFLAASLRANGYEVEVAADGSEALKLAEESIPDLLILDINMPGPDGFAVCQAVRRDLEVPIIMLSARGRERDKVQALDLGADDYLTKPFGAQELLARVRAALRRSGTAPKGPLPPFRVGALEVDYARRQVHVDGRLVQLTAREYEVLAYLARNAGKVLTHRQILQAVWGPEYGDEAHYVWTYVQRLRSKLEPDPRNPWYLLTIVNAGCRLRAPDEGLHAEVAPRVRPG